MESELISVLKRYVSDATARGILRSVSRTKMLNERLGSSTQHNEAFLEALGPVLRVFVTNREAESRCYREIESLLESRLTARDLPDVSQPIETEDDIVRARMVVKQRCSQLGFSTTEQVKVATVVSELARNIVNYAGRGEITCRALKGANDVFEGVEVMARDSGPGIPNLPEIMSGRYASKTGLGKGILGVKRLSDEFEIDTGPGRGTSIRARMFVPAKAAAARSSAARRVLGAA